MVEPNEIHQVEFLMDATMLRTWTSTMSCRWWDLFTTKPILLNLINADLYDLYILFRNAVQCAQLHCQFIFDQIPQVGYTEDAWIVRNSWGTGWDSRFLFLSIGWDSKPPFWGVQGEIPNHYHHHYHDVRWGEDGYITIWFLGGTGWDSWSLSWCQMGRRGIHPPGAGRRLWDGHKTPRWHRMCQRTWQWCRILLLMMVILMIGLVAIMMIMMMVILSRSSQWLAEAAFGHTLCICVFSPCICILALFSCSVKPYFFTKKFCIPWWIIIDPSMQHCIGCIECLIANLSSFWWKFRCRTKRTGYLLKL